jgi:hypothetical protein
MPATTARIVFRFINSLLFVFTEKSLAKLRILSKITKHSGRNLILFEAID